MIKYVNSYFFDFFSFIIKGYNKLFFGFFFDLNYNKNIINIYNIFIFNSLDIFFFLFNFEEIKLEHEKNFIKKEK